MRQLIGALASLRLAIVLLGLLLAALGVGTVTEALSGAEAAERTVYHAWWFMAIAGVLALSTLASLVALCPWGRWRAGYVMTHVAVVLILLGAAVSQCSRVEGTITLWPGQGTNEIRRTHDDQVIGTTPLPFTIRLEDFQVDHYPGSKRPSSFRSALELIEPGGATVRAWVWPNHELKHRGWRVYQSDYQEEDGRLGAVLSISKDPGQTMVFLGYGVLLLGLATVLGTRIVQARRMDKTEPRMARAPLDRAGVLCGLLVVLVTAGAVGWGLRARTRIINEDLESARRLPVQYDGRVMPLDSLAREVVWQVAGGTTLRDVDPVSTLLSWMFDLPEAKRAPVVKVDSAEVATAIGLSPSTTHASASDLETHRDEIAKAEEAPAERDPHQQIARGARALRRRLAWLERFTGSDALRVLPPEGNANGKWTAPRFANLAELIALVRESPPRGWPAPATIEREVVYNQVQPARVARTIFLGTLVLAVLAMWRRQTILDVLAACGVFSGLAVSTWGLGQRWLIVGHIPAATMYESLLFLAWGIALFGLLAFGLMRNRLITANAAGLAMVTLLLPDLFAIDQFVHPIPPILTGTPWLAVHVPITMLSYAVLTVAVAIAHIHIGAAVVSGSAARTRETITAPAAIGGRKHADLQRRTGSLLYWYVHIGSLLLAAGIITGSVWAASSWGRYWGWDPKEVWSLVAWLAYMAILHARHDRILDDFGVSATSIIAFQAIVMTYLGVNFVLSTGLHSYGMSDLPIARWMLLTFAVETTFLLSAFAIRRHRGLRG